MIDVGTDVSDSVFLIVVIAPTKFIINNIVSAKINFNLC